MQFVLVIYHGNAPLPGTPEAERMPEEDKKAAFADYAALAEMENWSGAPPMGLPQNATTVTVTDGATVLTEGPWLGTRHAVGGFAVVEAADLDAAVALAARVPQARLGGAVEVRPSVKLF
ncbi:YciI family protein [Nocardia niigatensis]|uniref:YciI family protein n=1 Tax=Nocardia niigatensis TaxID=209249 RepID=UPI0003090BB3|nr:YciI family protein [Nocardia niigatensis]